MSQNANSGQGPNSDQEAMRWFFISIGLFLVAIFIWAYYQPELNTVVGWVSWIHIYPYARIANAIPALQELPFFGPWLFQYASDGLNFLEQGGFAEMTPEERTVLLTIAGRCGFPVYIPIMIWAGISGREFRPDVAYRSRHSLESMIFMQSEHWITSRIGRHVNPLKLPEISSTSISRAILEREEKKGKTPDCGFLVVPDYPAVRPHAWQRSLRPEEYLVSTGMTFDHARSVEAKAMDWEYPSKNLEGRHMWPETDIASLSEILAAQLRSPWKGFEHLRPSHQGIAAVMALFYAYDIKGGNALLNDLSGVYDGIRAKTGGMDRAILSEDGLMSRIRKILDGKPGKNLKKIADNHAWVESAFPAMLGKARKDRGVLPASAFLWLKSEDRLMWYILDNVGSEAIMIEAAGAMSHYKAEVQIGFPIRRPTVFQAARSLRDDYFDVTEERLRMRQIKQDMAMTPEERMKKILAAHDKNRAKPSAQPKQDGKP